MINTANPVLNEAPEAFDGVRVDFAHHVDFFTVINPAMVVLVDMPIHHIVRRKVVGKDCALGEDMLFHQAKHRRAFYVGSDNGSDAALAFHHADDRSFFVLKVATHRASDRAFAPSPYVHLVHLNTGTILPAQRRSLLIVQHRANLSEHAPRGFVGDSRLALNLFRGDTATGLRHEVDRIEPSGQRSGRFMKDRVSGRVNVMAAVVTRIRRTAHNAMVLCGRLAFLAVNAIRVQVIAEPLQTGRIVWELFLKVLEGI